MLSWGLYQVLDGGGFMLVVFYLAVVLGLVLGLVLIVLVLVLVGVLV